MNLIPDSTNHSPSSSSSLLSEEHEKFPVEKSEDLMGEKRVLPPLLPDVGFLAFRREGGLLLRMWIGPLLRMLTDFLVAIFGGQERVGMMLRKIFFFGRRVGSVVVEKLVRFGELQVKISGCKVGVQEERF